MLRIVLSVLLLSLQLWAESYLDLIKSPKVYPDISDKLLDIRRSLLKKEKDNALKIVQNLKRELKNAKGEKIVLSYTVQQFEGVKTLKELNSKLSTAKGFCEIYKLREAENILRNLRSEIDVNLTYISKEVLKHFLDFEEALLKQKTVSYTAALSAVDSLFPEIKSEEIDYPITLLKIAKILKLKPLTLSDWESIYVNLKMARYLGYIDAVTYGDLKQIVDRALELSKKGKNTDKELEEFKIIFKTYFSF